MWRRSCCPSHGSHIGAGRRARGEATPGRLQGVPKGVPHGRQPSDGPGPGPRHRGGPAPGTSQVREQGAQRHPRRVQLGGVVADTSRASGHHEEQSQGRG